MTDPTAVADVLERAADALFVYGRARHTRFATDGRMCVVGSIQHAMGLAETERERYDPPSDIYSVPAVAALDARRPGGFFYIDTWNDSLRETPENDALVIDFIKSVAKDLRNEVTV